MRVVLIAAILALFVVPAAAKFKPKPPAPTPSHGQHFDKPGPSTPSPTRDSRFKN